MLLSCLVALAALTRAAPTRDLQVRGNGANAYAPATTTCPATKLVREATSVSGDEAEYVNQRKGKADDALAAWLAKQGSFCTTKLPVLALASSGGGQRALLETAGVIQAFDSRDGNETVGGIFQGLTYEAGLSGGAWFLSSLAGNNWPTVSYLQENLWNEEFNDSMLVPEDIFSTTGVSDYNSVVAQVQAKEDAGFATTLVDSWGRLLSYALLEGPDGGVSRRLSDLVDFSNFTSHEVPFPIVTGISFNASVNNCTLPTTAFQYEFTPFEYGSWDSGIAAFANTEYMGTDLSNGAPVDSSKCITQYDNLAYILGVSSDVWTGYCLIPQPSNETLFGIMTDITTRVDNTTVEIEDLSAFFPNPFFELESSPAVSEIETLTMIDGGLSGQVTPIWPFIQHQRVTDVLIATDNAGDTDLGWPNGTSIRQTYLSATEAGLTKMPFIPTPDVFVAEGLNTRATFFGCNETEKMMLIYLPNTEYVYPSNQSTAKLSYTPEETAGMIANGNAIARQNGTEGWPFCLACGIMIREENLPEGCEKCFEEYCYYE